MSYADKIKRQEEGLAALGYMLDNVISQAYGPDMGFCLLVFPFNEDQALASYISNGEREDIIQCLRQTITALEDNMNKVLQ